MFLRMSFTLVLALLAIPNMGLAKDTSGGHKEKEELPMKKELNMIHNAIKEDDIVKIKTLLDESQPDINKLANYVCKYGSTRVLELLVTKGLKLDVKDEKGYTLLHNAVFHNNLELTNYLIKHKQNINALSDEKRSVFILSANSSIEMFELLEKSSIKVSKVNKEDMIPETLRYNNLKLTKYLLTQGYPFNLDKYKEGETVSKHIENGDLDIIAFLVEHGLDIEEEFKWHWWGNTMICYTNAFEKEDITKYLLSKGASIHVRCNMNGNERYVDKAVKNSSVELYRILVKKGLDPKVKGEGSFDEYPLALAVKYNNVDVIKDMLKDGVDINVEVERYDVLVYLALKGRLEVLKMFIAKGANPIAFNEQRLQPIDYAGFYEQEAVVQYLKSFDKTDDFLKRYKQGKTTEKEYSNYAYKIIRSYNENNIKRISKDKAFKDIVYEVFVNHLKDNYSLEELTKALAIMTQYKVDGYNKQDILAYLDDFAYFKVLADALVTKEFIEDKQTYYMLIKLVEDNKLKEIQYLVEKGISLKYVYNNFQYHLLHRAITHADVNMLAYLVQQKDIDLQAEDQYQKLPIDMAMRMRNLGKIKVLMQYPTGKESYELVPSAFQTGDIEIIQYFMKKYKVDGTFAKQTQLLLYATAGRNKDAINLVLDLGIDINYNSADSSALAMAVKYRMVDMVAYLLEKRADTSIKTNGELLYIYSRWIDDRRKTKEQELEIIKLLLEHDVPTDSLLDGNSNTSLGLYIAENELDFARVLMEGGAKVDESDISVALYHDLDREFILELIKAFKSKDIKNVMNPLFEAVKYKDKEIMNRLLDKGVSLYEELDCTTGAAPIYAIGMSNDVESTAYALKKIQCIDTQRGWLKILAKDAKRDGFTEINRLVKKRLSELKPCGTELLRVK